MSNLETTIADDDATSLWRDFFTAVQFLTRIPIPDDCDATPESYTHSLRRAVLFFPLVGGLIGLATAAVALTTSIGFSPLVCGFLAIGMEALLTGAFHEDALADTCDALGGGWTREQVLEIMKDSRLGTYGTLGLVVGVGVRVAATATLLSAGWMWAMASIVAASTLARIAIIGMMISTPPITSRQSQAKDVSGMQTTRTLIVSALMTMPLWVGWFWLSPMTACGSTLAAFIVLLWFRRKILSRVQGTTGDLLGCSAFLVQLVILMGSTWSIHHG